jgi:hypothetical protein
MAAQQTFAFFQAGDPVRETTKTPPTNKPSATVQDVAQNAVQKAAERSKYKAAGTLRRAVRMPLPLKNSPQADGTRMVPATLRRQFSQNVSTDTASVLKRLRRQVGCVSKVSHDETEKQSTGCQAIDDLLPNQGLRVNALTEWVATTTSGAGALSLIAAANQLRHAPSSSPLVVIDTKGDFYPPAAVALGIPADRIVLVRTSHHGDVVWAIDQALRCNAVGAVWAHVGAWLDDRDARRFQLAAETGQTPGLLVRPTTVRGRPSFADVRFYVDQVSPSSLESVQEAAPHQFVSSGLLAQVTIDRCRGGTTGKQVLVQVDDQARIKPFAPVPSTAPLRISQPAAQHDTVTPRTTAAVHLADQLAHPTPTKRVAKKQERRA